MSTELDQSKLIEAWQAWKVECQETNNEVGVCIAVCALDRLGVVVREVNIQ